MRQQSLLQQRPRGAPKDPLARTPTPTRDNGKNSKTSSTTTTPTTSSHSSWHASSSPFSLRKRGRARLSFMVTGMMLMMVALFVVLVVVAPRRTSSSSSSSLDKESLLMAQQRAAEKLQQQQGQKSNLTLSVSQNQPSPTALKSNKLGDDNEDASSSSLSSYRQALLQVCGDELCDLSRPLERSTQFGWFGAITAHVHCPAVFASELLDASGSNGQSNYKPPRLRDVPTYFLDDYRMQGRAVLENWYISDVYLGGKAKLNTWSRALIETWKQAALQGDLASFGNYHINDRTTLFHALQHVAHIQGKSVLVVGSETPWVEALCLAAGATKVTTLEYGTIHSQHEQVHTYTPSAFRQAYLDNQLEMFDAIVSHSSLEHSGLGRYGDALNPWGDIMSLARVWCVTKPGGTLILGLSSGPEDKVYFNAGRIYSWHRWPYLTTNWLRMNYSAGWYEHPEQWRDGRSPLPARLRGPPGHEIYQNQSALVFRKTGPPGSVDELLDESLLSVPSQQY